MVRKSEPLFSAPNQLLLSARRMTPFRNGEHQALQGLFICLIIYAPALGEQTNKLEYYLITDMANLVDRTVDKLSEIPTGQTVADISRVPVEISLQQYLEAWGVANRFIPRRHYFRRGVGRRHRLAPRCPRWARHAGQASAIMYVKTK